MSAARVKIADALEDHVMYRNPQGTSYHTGARRDYIRAHYVCAANSNLIVVTFPKRSMLSKPPVGAA